MRVRVELRRRVTVRMIQSASVPSEDGRRTRHAEDLVVLRFIVCVTDVSSQRQTRGASRPPSIRPSVRSSLSFSFFASDCTNCLRRPPAPLPPPPPRPLLERFDWNRLPLGHDASDTQQKGRA